MARRSDLFLAVLVVLVLFIFFSRTREGLNDAPSSQKITASVSNPYTDGRTITLEYTYSASTSPPPTRAKAAIRSIAYLDKTGKQVGFITPPNTDANIPPSGDGGNRKWIINPPSGVSTSNLGQLVVVTYVYYVNNDSGQKTGEQSDDITTSIPVSA
jgi:hypothetical protein